MTYGTVDDQLWRDLMDAGINVDSRLMPEHATWGVEISVILNGALDQSFILRDDVGYEDVVNAVFDTYRESNPDSPLLVAAEGVAVSELLGVEADGFGTLYARGSDRIEFDPETNQHLRGSRC